MGVVEAMTADTVGRSGVEALLRMTRRAVDVGVTTHEREPRRGVIKARGLPIAGRVAASAGFAERSSMGIVLSMAIDAVVWRVSVGLSGCVALAADDGRVGSLERHVGTPVVEGFGMQHRDLCFGSLVFRVAGPAERRWTRGKVAVQPVRLVDIACDGRVARETQVVLAAAIEVPVAGPAVSRLALVGRDERTG